jgi:hypothetical protein
MKQTPDPSVALGGLGGPFEAPHSKNKRSAIAEPALVSRKLDLHDLPAPCAALGGLGGPFEAPHPNKQGRAIAEPAAVSTSAWGARSASPVSHWGAWGARSRPPIQKNKRS